MGDVITQRQDLPPWAQSFGFGGLNLLARALLNDPPDGGDIYDKDGKLRTDGGIRGYKAPDVPLPNRYNEVEQGARDYIFNKAQSGQPLRDSMDQRLMDLLGRGDPNAVDTMGDLADEQRMFTMGGPAAGASRNALMSALTGALQGKSEQALYDSLSGPLASGASQGAYSGLMGTTQGAADQTLLNQMFGGGAAAADQSAYSTLGNERDIARSANFANFLSPNMGAARSKQLETIQGNFLYPGSNPFLDSTADAMSRRLGNAYRYGTAPSTDAAFARAGSFGGSAHQQTKQMQQFDYGQNLSDSLNQLYGDNYNKERQNMLNAGSEALQFGNQSLENERNRQYGTQQQLLQEKLEAALNERSGWRSMVENELARGHDTAINERAGWRSTMENQLQRGAQTAEGQAGRDIQLLQLFPELMRSRYDDGDIGRMLGAEKRGIEDARNQVEYQNDFARYQWPFKALEMLGSGIASFTGGQSVQTATNPNSNSAAANGLGTGLLSVGALSQLGGQNGFGWWGGNGASGGAG